MPPKKPAKKKPQDQKAFDERVLECIKKAKLQTVVADLVIELRRSRNEADEEALSCEENTQEKAYARGALQAFNNILLFLKEEGIIEEE